MTFLLVFVVALKMVCVIVVFLLVEEILATTFSILNFVYLTNCFCQMSKVTTVRKS